MKKIIGWISTAELTWYEKTKIEDADGIPIILEIWKDREDLRYCAKGTHIKKVEIKIKNKKCEKDYGTT